MERKKPYHIKNIVFDLGGVLLDIHTQKVQDAILQAGVMDARLMFQRLAESKAYYRFETGRLSWEDFFAEIRIAAETDLPDPTITQCWNLMLSDFPEGRVRLLQNLSGTYKLFLLSNTNSIHHAYFSSRFLAQYGFEIEKLFQKAYYSYQVKMHKPEKAIFEYLLKDSALIPQETLFIDDTPANCETAASCGIVSRLKPADMELESLFQEGVLKLD